MMLGDLQEDMNKQVCDDRRKEETIMCAMLIIVQY